MGPRAAGVARRAMIQKGICSRTVFLHGGVGIGVVGELGETDRHFLQVSLGCEGLLMFVGGVFRVWLLGLDAQFANALGDDLEFRLKGRAEFAWCGVHRLETPPRE